MQQPPPARVQATPEPNSDGKYVLEPFRLLKSHLVPQKQPAFEGKWEALVKHFRASPEAKRKLMVLRTGHYVGTYRPRGAKEDRLFVLVVPSHGPRVRVRNHPTLEDEIQTFYKVTAVGRPAEITSTSEQTEPAQYHTPSYTDLPAIV